MTPPNKVFVILIRGLLGMIWSRGMDTLSGKLRSRGYQTEVWNHSFFFLAWFANTSSIVARCRSLIGQGYTVVLVGHSFGGNVVLMVARALGLPLKVIFVVDPAAQFDCSVSSNVQKAFGFRNVVAGNLGQGQLTPKAPRIVDIPLTDNHVYIDDDPRVHNRILSEIATI